MKLAFCLFRYYPFGGLERDFLRIALEAQSRGHQITVYTMSWDGDIPDGFSVNIVPAKGYGNHARCLSFSKNLGNILKNKDFDLVVGFNRMPGLDVYYSADICHIANSDKYGKWYKFIPRNLAYSILERAVFDRKSHSKILLLAPSHQETYQKYYETSKERFFLLPPGIDRDRMANLPKSQCRTEIVKELNLEPAQNLLLMVGSDFRRKGVDRAIRALAALPVEIRNKTYLIIIGNGKSKSLLTLAKFLGVQQQVLFLGARQDVGRFMRAADLLLHPAYYEAGGMVLLEALVAELPVLVTENCGYAFHIAKANAGMVVPGPYQQKTFNSYLKQMLLATNKIHWQENARSYATNTDLYSLPTCAVDLFEQFAQEKKGTAIISSKKSHCVILDPILKNFWGDKKNLFDAILQSQGKVYRHEKNRKTLRFEVEQKGYFIKIHEGVGWGEIFKNLIQGRLPILGAKREWIAIQRLKKINVPTMNLVAYGTRGFNPAGLQSFVATEELKDMVSLEDYCRDWAQTPPALSVKRQLIAEVARIARLIHKNGMNHRDLYICHFLYNVKIPLQLFLIDLHRMQIHLKTPRRWLVQDIAALYFSTMELGLKRRDFLYFIKKYRDDKKLKEVLHQEEYFWQQVSNKANKLYEKIQSKSYAIKKT